MGLLVKGLLLAVAGYVGAGAFMTYFQRRFQYFPGGELRTPEQAGVPEFRPAFIPTGDGLDLGLVRPGCGPVQADSRLFSRQRRQRFRARPPYTGAVGCGVADGGYS